MCLWTGTDTSLFRVCVLHSFTDVHAGCPGSSSSTTVLSSSSLSMKAVESPDRYLFPREVRVWTQVPIGLDLKLVSLIVAFNSDFL